jgi:arsenate reductase
MPKTDVTIYHNPRCTKSRETLALLEQKGIQPRVIEYLKTPPSTADLKSILKALGLKAVDIVRKKEAAEAGIDPTWPEDKLVVAMAENPIIIERPIVVVGAKAVLGRPPENVLRLI